MLICSSVNGHFKVACEKSNNLIDDHFLQVGKMVSISSNTQRKQEKIELK